MAWLPFAFLVIFSFLFLSDPIALAAAGEGTATIDTGTGGNNASDATYVGAGAAGNIVVSELTYIRLDLTVGASHIAASQNNVTAQINTNLCQQVKSFTQRLPEYFLTQRLKW